MANLIQFYDAISDNDYYRQVLDTKIRPDFITPHILEGNLMPFQCFLGDTLGANFVYQIAVVKLSDGYLKDITGDVTCKKISTTNGKYLIHAIEEVVSRIDQGAFYLRVKAISLDGLIQVFKYSDIICNSYLDAPLKIEYYSDKQIDGSLYQTTFTNIATFQAQREFAESELTEEVKLRGVVELPIQSVLINQVSFKLMVSDSVRQAIESIVLHEFNNFTFAGVVYEAQKRCVVSSSYMADRDLHEVTIIVPYKVELYRESLTNDTATELGSLPDFDNSFSNDFNIL